MVRYFIQLRPFAGAAATHPPSGSSAAVALADLHRLRGSYNDTLMAGICQAVGCLNAVHLANGYCRLHGKMKHGKPLDSHDYEHDKHPGLSGASRDITAILHASPLLRPWSIGSTYTQQHAKEERMKDGVAW